MNTIEITNPFAIVRPAVEAPIARNFEKELFLELQACWKAAAKAKTITSSSIAAWAIIRGANPKKGFAPITNAVKLANGASPWAAFDEAIGSCSRCSGSALAPWAELLGKQGAAYKGWQWSGSHPLLALLATAKA